MREREHVERVGLGERAALRHDRARLAQRFLGVQERALSIAPPAGEDREVVVRVAPIQGHDEPRESRAVTGLDVLHPRVLGRKARIDEAERVPGDAREELDLASPWERCSAGEERFGEDRDGSEALRVERAVDCRHHARKVRRVGEGTARQAHRGAVFVGIERGRLERSERRRRRRMRGVGLVARDHPHLRAPQRLETRDLPMGDLRDTPLNAGRRRGGGNVGDDDTRRREAAEKAREDLPALRIHQRRIG